MWDIFDKTLNINGNIEKKCEESGYNRHCYSNHNNVHYICNLRHILLFNMN
jgi:hypothetical protein